MNKERKKGGRKMQLTEKCSSLTFWEFKRGGREGEKWEEIKRKRRKGGN